MKTLKALIRAYVVYKSEYPNVDSTLKGDIEIAISSAALHYARQQTPKTVSPRANKYGLDATEIALARQPEFIQAIKAYRGRTGLGLKESKEAVERYLDKHNLPKYKTQPW